MHQLNWLAGQRHSRSMNTMSRLDQQSMGGPMLSQTVAPGGTNEPEACVLPITISSILSAVVFSTLKNICAFARPMGVKKRSKSNSSEESRALMSQPPGQWQLSRDGDVDVSSINVGGHLSDDGDKRLYDG